MEPKSGEKSCQNRAMFLARLLYAKSVPLGSQREAHWLPKGHPKSCKIMPGASVDSLGLPEGGLDLIWKHVGALWGAFWSIFRLLSEKCSA